MFLPKDSMAATLCRLQSERPRWNGAGSCKLNLCLAHTHSLQKPTVQAMCQAMQLSLISWE